MTPSESGEAMRTFAVYWNPSDYPNMYVVREHRVFPGRVVPADAPRAVVHTIWAARAAIPDGLARIERQPEDDVAIVEVWL